MSSASLQPDPLSFFIGGEYHRTGNLRANINPSDISDQIVTVCDGDGSHVQAAINAARSALPGWAASTPEFRHDILARTGEHLINNKNQLGTLLAREEGKTLKEAIAEVVRSGRIFQFFAGEAIRNGGDFLRSARPGVEITTSQDPVGVVGVIAPWNFPMAIPAWKIAPALAFGNCVVFKPAEFVPSSAWMMVDALHKSGLPSGVLNLVFGAGSVVGHAMLEAPEIDAITFTGSQSTGSLVAAACSKHMRKVQLEMGGKNPLVILNDADLDRAVECAVDGAFFSTGQRCTASSRLVVTEGAYTRFVEKLLARMQSLKVGNALDEQTDIGPVVSQAQLEQNNHYVELARQEGGNVRANNGALTAKSEGYYFLPVLITDTTPQMTINREEVFGPVASVIRVRDYEEALHVANDTPFGLCAGICTQSLKHATHFRANAQAGMVMVNLPTAGVDYHVPFGGTKASSLGHREQGTAAREFFTQSKTAYTWS